MKKKLVINGTEYFVCVNDTNEISFYHIEKYVDDWSLKNDVKLIVNNVGNIKNPTGTIRQILKELTKIVFTLERDFYFFIPTDEKRKRIYMNFLEKNLENEYNVQEAENKIYLFRNEKQNGNG